MRILQIVHSLPSLNQAGTEIYAYDLSRELSKKHQVFIFTRMNDLRQKDYEVTVQREDGITVYFINKTFRKRHSFEMFYENETIDKKFSELLDEIKPDIIHIQHLLFLSIGMIEEIGRKGIPMVFTLHDYWLFCPKWHLLKEDYQPCDKAEYGEFDKDCAKCLEGLFHANSKTIGLYTLCRRILPGSIVSYLKKSYLSFLKQMPNNHNVVMKLKSRASSIKTLLGKVRLFLAPSQCLMDRFIAFGIPQFKIKLSTFGLKDNFSLNLQENRSKKIRFGFIGTILPAKGLHVLINAFNDIQAKEIELKIYGKLRSYAGFEDYPFFLKRIKKNNNIKFMGEFNHLEIGKIFKEIDVLVVPSIWYENSPFAIQEAFLTKTPVIASRIGGIPELVTDGVNGLLFSPGDVNELQAKIQYIIDNPHLLVIFKENIPRIKSIEDNSEEIEEVYSNLVINNR